MALEDPYESKKSACRKVGELTVGTLAAGFFGGVANVGFRYGASQVPALRDTSIFFHNISSNNNNPSFGDTSWAEFVSGALTGMTLHLGTKLCAALYECLENAYRERQNKAIGYVNPSQTVNYTQ